MLQIALPPSSEAGMFIHWIPLPPICLAWLFLQAPF